MGPGRRSPARRSRARLSTPCSRELRAHAVGDGGDGARVVPALEAGLEAVHEERVDLGAVQRDGVVDPQVVRPVAERDREESVPGTEAVLDRGLVRELGHVEGRRRIDEAA